MSLSIEEKITVPCIFCNGIRKFSYRLNGYELYRCTNCNTLGVSDMPSEEQLFHYYQGFNFQANEENLNKVKTHEIKTWLKSFLYKTPSRMLDVGGGGGFFAKAFEEFGLGEATYIDLDESACLFAKEKMNLNHIFHGSIGDYCMHNQDCYFDLIYVRHVIEHLIDPVTFIRNCVKLLSQSGTLIVQCPNGDSKEGLWFPSYWWKFLRTVACDNDWGKAYALAYSMSSKYGWGIDPPRHLWAVSGSGIQQVFAQDSDYDVKICSASLANAIYSPYWSSNTITGKIRNRICNHLFGPVFPGMHLIAFITRQKGKSLKLKATMVE